MKLFVIGDLHLSIGVPGKPMNIFRGWENHMEILEKNWRETVGSEDTVVIAGDSSWAMSLLQAYKDFEFINSLPGRKIILKGNHDYWWSSMKKMTEFFESSGFSTLSILHNNHYSFGEYGICGTRGWVNMPGEEFDAKVLSREVGRLEASIKSAVSGGLKPIVFMHYPPIYGNNCNYDILDVLFKYDVKTCYYGHIHGPGFKYAINGERDGIKFELISGDFVQFKPVFVL